MRTHLGVVMAVVMAVTPVTTMAGQFSAGNDFLMPVTRQVVGNLHVAAGTITIGGGVSGDVYAAGGTISTTGAVSGDIGVIGGTVQVLGPVSGDVRAVAGQVTLNNRVEGDVVVAGGTLHVLPGAMIAGDLTVAGGQVIIDGTIRGSARIMGGQTTLNGVIAGGVDVQSSERLTIGAGARITGPLSYRAPTEATIAEGAVLTGGVTYSKMATMRFNAEAPKQLGWALVSALTAVKLLSLLVLTALLLWLWRRQSLALLTDARSNFVGSLGRGMVYLLLTPIAIVLLAVSIIGMFPAMLTGMLYCAAIILSRAFAGMLVGSWLMSKWKKSSVLHLDWVSGLGGVIVLSLAGLVPVLGWILNAALFLAVFGALAHAVQRRILTI
jgi:cytoskeletal protein CcmA (bactofilin family)